jgi:hypothetical protein
MASPKGLFFNTLFCVALGLGGAATAHAATVTIDISVASDQIGITSYDVNGFRFTAEQGVFSMRKYGGGSGDYFWFGSTDPALEASARRLRKCRSSGSAAASSIW